MKKYKIWPFLNSLILVGILTFSLVKWEKEPRMVYADVNEVFEKFDLQKEMENDLTRIRQKRQQKLDSLKQKLMDIRERGEEGNDKDHLKKKFKYLSSKYRKTKQEFERTGPRIKQNMTNEAWGQMEAYIKDYAQKKGYRLILGKTLDGSVLYGEDQKDITEELVEHVNKRYHGRSE